MLVQERDGRVRRVRRPSPARRCALGAIQRWLASGSRTNRRKQVAKTYQWLLDVTDERVFA